MAVNPHSDLIALEALTDISQPTEDLHHSVFVGLRLLRQINAQTDARDDHLFTIGRNADEVRLAIDL